MMVVYALYGVAALVVLAPIAIALGVSAQGKAAATGTVYGASLIVTLDIMWDRADQPVRLRAKS